MEAAPHDHWWKIDGCHDDGRFRLRCGVCGRLKRKARGDLRRATLIYDSDQGGWLIPLGGFPP